MYSEYRIQEEGIQALEKQTKSQLPLKIFSMRKWVGEMK